RGAPAPARPAPSRDPAQPGLRVLRDRHRRCALAQHSRRARVRLRPDRCRAWRRREALRRVVEESPAMKTRLFTGRRGRTPAADHKPTGTRRDPERSGLRINELAADVLTAILAFRAAPAGAQPPYRQLREEMVELIADFQRRAARADLDPEAHALLALVALAD